MLDQANAIADELVRLRRDIHQHPELGFQEFRTAALVADTLREIGGIEVQTGVGRTGIVGQIGSGNGPTLAIRADMDALPIQEKSEQPYCSTNNGVMHACGHDAHTAILLGTALLLKQSFAAGSWQGNVRFLFQPCEETFDENGISGATAMIADGALQDVDAVIALHVAAHRPAGQCHFSDGYSLAAVDTFEGWITGTGGHGASPHNGSDPIYMLGHILNALYAIPSRHIDPLRRSVVSVGQVHGGHAENVIPNEIFVQGTIRSMDAEVRAQLATLVEDAFRLSELLGGGYRFALKAGYPSLYNNPQVNGWMHQVAEELIGDTVNHDEPFAMGAEDFAYMTQEAKGAMFMLGAAIDDGLKRHHHTDIFDIDESVLSKGAAVLAETAHRFVTGKLA
jgi:amidohydrolase